MTLTSEHLSPEQRTQLVQALQARFEQNMHRHPDIAWSDVQSRLESTPEKLWSLNEMERTGGEPDVVGYDVKADVYVFYDCAAESPSGRRSACYDREGWESRKKFRPENNALDMASAMGVELLNEAEYRSLQALGPIDTTTSSWLHTPTEVRVHGGALFGDYRYGRVFTYHNGAQSYYAARGFRGKLTV